MVEYVIAAAADGRVAAIRAEHRQEDHRPDRAGVLEVAGARFAPMSVRLLRVQDRPDRTGQHHFCLRLPELGVVRRPVEQVAQGEVAHSWVCRIGFQKPGQWVAI